jgi:hypothetical protein
LVIGFKTDGLGALVKALCTKSDPVQITKFHFHQNVFLLHFGRWHVVGSK